MIESEVEAKMAQVVGHDVELSRLGFETVLLAVDELDEPVKLLLKAYDQPMISATMYLAYKGSQDVVGFILKPPDLDEVVATGVLVDGVLVTNGGKMK